jgi:hypothetical protein
MTRSEIMSRLNDTFPGTIVKTTDCGRQCMMPKSGDAHDLIWWLHSLFLGIRFSVVNGRTNLLVTKVCLFQLQLYDKGIPNYHFLILSEIILRSHAF